MSHYSHFTTEERELSRVMKAQGFSDRAIARSLKRSNSSVSREFARNSLEDGTYSATPQKQRYENVPLLFIFKQIPSQKIIKQYTSAAKKYDKIFS